MSDTTKPCVKELNHLSVMSDTTKPCVKELNHVCYY